MEEKLCKDCGRKLGRGHKFSECSKIKFKDSIITKEFLIKEYLEKKRSSNDIALKLKEEFNIKTGATEIIKYLKRYDISKRSVKESKNTEDCKRKYEETCLKNSGFKHNFCKENPSRKRWENKLLKEEGITNVFQREEVKEKSKISMLKNWGVEIPYRSEEIQEKGRQTSLLKYGVCHWMKNDTNKDLFFKNQCEKLNIKSICEPALGYNWGHIYTKPHRKIVEFLENNNISTQIEYIIEVDNKELNRRYFKYDILIKNTNKLLEINGDFWHANPSKYIDSDIICSKWWSLTAKEIWEKDKVKIDYAIEKGYNLLTLWESDINKSFDKIKEEVLKYAKT